MLARDASASFLCMGMEVCSEGEAWSLHKRFANLLTQKQRKQLLKIQRNICGRGGSGVYLPPNFSEKSMNEIFPHQIAAALGLADKQVRQTLALLDEGATIPFISRYRKEATGGLDEVQVEAVRDRYEKLKETGRRKTTILSTIEEQGKLTPELRQRIEACWDNTELEDIYLPYKPKRKTRAEAARQKGLEPLAALLISQREAQPEVRAQAFVRGEVKDVAYDEQGRKRMEQVVRTAGEHYRIVLQADKDTLDAGLRDEDLAFVTVSVVDREGNLCPDAQHRVKFSVRGAGYYKAGANGNPVCLEPFSRPQMTVFNGRMTAIVAEKGQAGTIRLKAEAKGLKSGELLLQVVPSK